ncbi:MAG: glycosyltransferase family 4 protein [Acidobacteriota bacterium]
MRTRIALLPSEPIRARMAGIGIRYAELTRQLTESGFEVVLLTAGTPEDVPSDLQRTAVDIRPFRRGNLARLLTDCQAAVGQGQLANDLILECPQMPIAIDLYDPWLIENMAYTETLGLAPYKNDHATWMLQLSQGDFFLCSCEEQRLYYLGLLTAAGRVNPPTVHDDPDVRNLIDVVPFGVPGELPPHRPVLGPQVRGTRKLLFGALYDWYDPWPVLRALELLERPGWTVLFIRTPNAESTPQQRLQEIADWAQRKRWWGTRVQVLDWIPANRRYDLMRDVDVLVASHRHTLETRLSLRTRFLDALAVGCPVVTSEGGAIAGLLRDYDAGWVVPSHSPKAMAAAIAAVVEGGEEAKRHRQPGVDRLLESFTWERATEPLVRFLRAPHIDERKATYAFRPPTLAPERFEPTTSTAAEDAAGHGPGFGGRLRRLFGRGEG